MLALYIVITQCGWTKVHGEGGETKPKHSLTHWLYVPESELLVIGPGIELQPMAQS